MPSLQVLRHLSKEVLKDFSGLKLGSKKNSKIILEGKATHCLYRRLWRACNLTSFSPCLTIPVDYPFASVTRDPGSKPMEGHMWNRDAPVSVVSLHWWPWRDWSFLWPRLRRASSQTITRPSCRQCDNPTWSHTALISQFHARCRSPFRLHNRRSQLLGGALWRACNLTSFSPCLTGPVDYPFASRHKGPRFKTPGGPYVKPEFSC